MGFNSGFKGLNYMSYISGYGRIVDRVQVVESLELPAYMAWRRTSERVANTLVFGS